MKLLSRFLPALALPLVVALTAHAEINPAQIPADAKWVVHADVGALRTTAMGKELLELAKSGQASLNTMRVGIDIEKLVETIGSITAYGANFSADPSLMDGTLVISGSADLQKIADSLLLQGNIAAPDRVTEVKDLPYPAYSLTEPANAKNNTAKQEVFIALPPEKVILISRSRAQLQRARDLLSGSAPSIARSPNAPLAKLLKPARGAFLFGASMVPPEEMFPQDGPQTRILQMTDSASIAIGELDSRTFAHAELSASSDGDADKLVRILQGLTAMFSLAQTNDKQLSEFLNSTMVTRNGDVVTLHLAYDTRRLIEMAHEITTPPPPPPRPQAPPATRNLDQWTATASNEPAYAAANAAAVHVITPVDLKNRTTITLGSRSNDGSGSGFAQVEISPVQGGSPMLFTAGAMRRGNERGANTVSFDFPGEEGTYTLKVTYANDPQGKANYYVSARDPRTPPPAPSAPAPARN